MDISQQITDINNKINNVEVSVCSVQSDIYAINNNLAQTNGRINGDIYYSNQKLSNIVRRLSDFLTEFTNSSMYKFFMMSDPHTMQELQILINEINAETEQL